MPGHARVLTLCWTLEETVEGEDVVIVGVALAADGLLETAGPINSCEDVTELKRGTEPEWEGLGTGT